MLIFYKLIVLSFLINAITGIDNYENQQLAIRKIAKDAAWLWFNNESILFINESLYIGCEDSMGNSQVVMYQINDNPVNFSGIDYNLSSWETRRRRYPTHNYPSLIKTQNGSILAVYHISGNHLYARTGQIINEGKPTQQLAWGKETVIQLISGMNYSNLLQLSSDDALYNFFSLYNQSPSLIVSKDQGKSWGNEMVFMRQGGTGTSPYMRLCSNGIDRIDILYTNGHPRTETQNSIYHLYFKDHSFFRTDGSRIASLNELIHGPLLPTSGTQISNGSISGPGWVWDIEYDTDHNPVAAFITSADGKEGMDLRYYYAKWNANKGKWFVQQIAYAGNHLYVPENHFAGGITIDPENSSAVYISSNVDPVTGRSVTGSHYQIYRGVTSDGGNSWDWKQLTNDDDRDNLRPIVPKGHNFEFCVIWFSQKISPGKGFDSEIRGIFEK